MAWSFGKYIKQKQSSIGGLRNFAKFTWKHLCQSLFFNKVTRLRPATSLKKETLEQVFSCVKFLRTPFFIEQLWWLFLINDNWVDKIALKLLWWSSFSNIQLDFYLAKRSIYNTFFLRAMNYVRRKNKYLMIIFSTSWGSWWNVTL